MENDLLKRQGTVFVERSEMSMHKENSSTFYDYNRAQKCTVPLEDTRMYSFIQQMEMERE